MKTCIIFRGENVREKRGYMNPVNNIKNWKETIFDVIDCDVVFFTYPSDKLEELVALVKPVHVCTTGYSDQFGCASTAAHWMNEHKDAYDRFVICRFDFTYRYRITEWIHWDKNGIILVNKDCHWPSTHLYADVLFIVDSTHLGQFIHAMHSPAPLCLHHIGRQLLNENVDGFHVMYSKYHHMTDHPLHALMPIEEYPDLENPLPGIEVVDISRWN